MSLAFLDHSVRINVLAMQWDTQILTFGSELLNSTHLGNTINLLALLYIIVLQPVEGS